MIVRILWIQTKANLTLWTFMKVVLRMVAATSTEFPIASNSTIGTTERIMKDVLLNCGQHLPERLQSHFHTQILLKPLKGLHHLQLPFRPRRRRTTSSPTLRRCIRRGPIFLGTSILRPQRRMAESSWRKSRR